LLTCDEHSTVRLLQSLGTTWRVLLNDTARQVQAIERAGATEHAAFGGLISGTVARDRCYAEGDWRHGMVSLGPSIAFAQSIEPLQAIVNGMVDEAVQAISALGAMYSQNGMEQE
jgi:nitronate monooxygenase